MNQENCCRPRKNDSLQTGSNLSSATASPAQLAAARLAASVVQAGRSAACAARAHPAGSLRSSCPFSRNDAANIAAASAALRAVESVDASQLEVDDVASQQTLSAPSSGHKIAHQSSSCSGAPESEHESHHLECNASVVNVQEVRALASSQCYTSPQETEPIASVSSITDEAAEIWDVVVDKTFIDVVLRRPVLPHTKSAPGRLRRSWTPSQREAGNCSQVTSSETVLAPEATQNDAADCTQKQSISVGQGDLEPFDSWDVVIDKTFISVVPRRPHSTLAHTASAPGCLATSKDTRRPSCDKRRSISRRRGRPQQSRGRGRSQKPEPSAYRRVGQPMPVAT
eukprot:TRINITY_DN22904_c0_g1_i1.p1 TRINITY_DN22904_c0_g1~~TRINITY_DN22904_c0_g1_i1.p1  ORF type:complete len:341 (+),score=47.60 TRINITY_DN22904_c0_g1_i1:106-1128(+)